MCQFKSGLIFKDSIYIPDHDDHTDMLRELGVDDTKQNAEHLFVRAELYPKNNDCFSDIKAWVFKIDHDIRPSWFVEDYERLRMVEAVEAWASNHIHINKVGLILNEGIHYIKDCKDIELHGSSTVMEMHDSSTVREMSGSSTVREMSGSSTVQRMCGSSTVQQMYGNSTVLRMCGSSTVWGMYGSSTVREMYGNSTVLRMCGSSTVMEMHDSSTVREMSGSSTVREMSGSSTVLRMYGSSTVREMYGNSTVLRMYGSSTVGEMYGNSIATSCVEHITGNLAMLILSGNSTFRDGKNKTLYQSGGWKVVSAQ